MTFSVISFKAREKEFFCKGSFAIQTVKNSRASLSTIFLFAEKSILETIFALAYRQFSTAETEYMKACNQDDEQNQWEKEEILNACTDILTVTVKEVLEDEEDFIQ